MEKHNGIITFSDETYKNILDNIKEVSYSEIKKDPERDAIDKVYYEGLVLAELKRDLGDDFFGEINVDLDAENMFDFRNGTITLNPRSTEDNIDRTEFLVKKCRYTGANLSRAEKAPEGLYYRDVYHVYEVLRYVFIRNLYNIAQTNTDLGNYYKEVIKQLTDPKIIGSKKFNSAKTLNYIRYANASAGKFICELYRNVKPSSMEGCFQLLGYILYTENLLDGYTKDTTFSKKVPCVPIDETNKILGIKNNPNFSSLSLEERIIHGAEISDDEKKLIKSISFDGKARGTFDSFYGRNGIKGIFK